MWILTGLVIFVIILVAGFVWNVLTPPYEPNDDDQLGAI